MTNIEIPGMDAVQYEIEATRNIKVVLGFVRVPRDEDHLHIDVILKENDCQYSIDISKFDRKKRLEVLERLNNAFSGICERFEPLRLSDDSRRQLEKTISRLKKVD